MREYDLIEPETNVGPNFRDATVCLKELCRYQAPLLFAAEMLTKWNAEPAAADQLRREARAAEDICSKLAGKMLRVMKAKGMTDAQMEDYFRRHGLFAIPWQPREITFSGKTAKGIAEVALMMAPGSLQL